MKYAKTVGRLRNGSSKTTWLLTLHCFSTINGILSDNSTKRDNILASAPAQCIRTNWHLQNVETMADKNEQNCHISVRDFRESVFTQKRKALKVFNIFT